MKMYAFSALILLIGWQEEHPVGKRTECWYAGYNDLTGAR